MEDFCHGFVFEIPPSASRAHERMVGSMPFRDFERELVEDDELFASARLPANGSDQSAEVG